MQATLKLNGLFEKGASGCATQIERADVCPGGVMVLRSTGIGRHWFSTCLIGKPASVLRVWVIPLLYGEHSRRQAEALLGISVQGNAIVLGMFSGPFGTLFYITHCIPGHPPAPARKEVLDEMMLLNEVMRKTAGWILRPDDSEWRPSHLADKSRFISFF